MAFDLGLSEEQLDLQKWVHGFEGTSETQRLVISRAISGMTIR